MSNYINVLFGEETKAVKDKLLTMKRKPSKYSFLIAGKIVIRIPNGLKLFISLLKTLFLEQLALILLIWLADSITILPAQYVTPIAIIIRSKKIIGPSRYCNKSNFPYCRMVS